MIKKSENEAKCAQDKGAVLEENRKLKKQLEEAKALMAKLKSESDKSHKENLKRNFVEWQKIEKANYAKMKKSMENEIEQRVRKAKAEAEEGYMQQLELAKKSFSAKEGEIQNFYEEKTRNDTKAMEEKFQEKLKHDKEMLRGRLLQQLEEEKRVRRSS